VRDRSEVVDVDLSDGERRVLDRGLAEWGGPAACTDALAVAMGFEGVADLAVQWRRLLDALKARAPLSRWDWTRILFATEIVFVSDVVGSGVEWTITTGLDDAETVGILRDLQRKLVTVRVQIGPSGAWRTS
jgi:hypothetical protein